MKPGISTDFTLNNSVNSKISLAIASLVHVDVPLAPSTFHKQIVCHDPVFNDLIPSNFENGWKDSAVFSLLILPPFSFCFLVRFLLDRV